MSDYDPWMDEEEDAYNGIPDDCWHEEADINILDGRAVCPRCGHAWWATNAEMDAELQWMIDYAEYEEHERAAEMAADLQLVWC